MIEFLLYDVQYSKLLNVFVDMCEIYFSNLINLVANSCDHFKAICSERCYRIV